MSGIVHHLVSRGFEETHQRLKSFDHEGKPQPTSPWKATSLVITVIVYMFAMFAVRYTSFFTILPVMAVVLMALQDRVHIRLRCCHLGHGRNTHGHRVQARYPRNR